MRRNELIQKAIELGCMSGFVTFDQLNELLPTGKDAIASEEIEALMEAALGDEDINVVEGE